MGAKLTRRLADADVRTAARRAGRSPARGPTAPTASDWSISAASIASLAHTRTLIAEPDKEPASKEESQSAMSSDTRS